MPTYILEAYLPRSRQLLEVDGLARVSAVTLRREGRPVHHLEAIYLPADETCFLLVEAEGQDVVEDLGSRLEIAVVRIPGDRAAKDAVRPRLIRKHARVW